MYTPRLPFTVAAAILTPTESKVNGVVSKTYTETVRFFCSARSFGGTEKVVDGVYVLEDTIKCETWYNPAIKAGCRVRLLESGADYDIVGTPEDIEMRHAYMVFTIRRVKGGA
jgi:hypothetical protein